MKKSILSVVFFLFASSIAFPMHRGGEGFTAYHGPSGGRTGVTGTYGGSNGGAYGGGGTPGAGPHDNPSQGPRPPGGFDARYAGYGGTYGGGNTTGVSTPAHVRIGPKYGIQIPANWTPKGERTPVPPRDHVGGRGGYGVPTEKQKKWMDDDDARIRKENDELDEIEYKYEKQMAEERNELPQMASLFDDSKMLLVQRNPSLTETSHAKTQRILALMQRNAAQTADEVSALQGEYNTGEFANEIRSWNIHSAQKVRTLKVSSRYVGLSLRLKQNQSAIEASLYELIHTSISAGFDSLTEAAKIAGGHHNGNNVDALEVSQEILEFSKALLDIGLGLTPGVSIGKDVYEALTGKSLIDGSKLDLTARSLAVVGAVTAGGSNIVKSSFVALSRIAKALKARGILGKGFQQSARIVDSAGTIFDSIKATQPVYKGSVIPKSFELTTSSSKIWVHGNATEHMAEYAAAKAKDYAPEAVRMASQVQLASLKAAVETAIAQGIKYGEMVKVGGWELRFELPRKAGELPALIHALHK